MLTQSYIKPKGYRPILGQSSTKTVKGEKKGYLTGICYLAPSDSSGIGNVCPQASAGCRAACLAEHSGRMIFDANRKAREAKTALWFSDRSTFLASLRYDIARLGRQAARKGMVPVVRVNGASDIPGLAMAMAADFPEVQFYDYSKIPGVESRQRANYTVVFSRSESNEAECLKVLAAGCTVAVVFSGPLPATWHGYPVIDGDETDLRFLDPKGVVVGLSPKGAPAKHDTSGFVVIQGAA